MAKHDWELFVFPLSDVTLLELDFLLSQQSSQLNMATDLQALKSAGEMISIASTPSSCHVKWHTVNAKNMFPFQLCEILLGQIIWKTTSCYHRNLFAILERFFSKYLRFHFSFFSSQVNGNPPNGTHWTCCSTATCHSKPNKMTRISL